MPGQYAHLHAHSSYSLLDGLARIDDLVQTARNAGMPALALTDHGVMFGAIEFYSSAREAGVKPIVGCEVYVADSPLEKKPGPQSKSYHLVLLAENAVGYRNLISLTTEAHLRGFYRKPRIDRALLERHADGLICLSGCASGELARAILDGDLAAAEELADWHSQVFPGRYFLELQYHGIDFQKSINQGVLHLHGKLGLPLVATNDVHYVHARQARAHDVLLCIQTQTVLTDPKRMRMETQQFYLKSADEMEALFGHCAGAVSNTLEIADRCNLEIDFGRPQLPAFETPLGRTSATHLRILCEEGLQIRYPNADEAVRSRLEYELSVISATGFVDYFLLVHDVIHFARTHDIPVGPGRGSAAASIVAYCLFITNIDPLAHGLSFERFLNPERITMPDMDLDFADDRRDELIRYVTDRYGRDRVAQIITFGTMGVKAGVRDVGRVLGMPYPEVDRVAKLIPPMCSRVQKARDESPELNALYESDTQLRELLDTVADLEGVARHASTHAAGVLISRDSLTDHVPLYKVPKSEQITSQYAMNSIEKLGLLKMDFLGLRTLTILKRACEFVRQTRGVEIDLDAIPLDDPTIYQLLGSGETFGVFQVDKGIRSHIRNLRPTEFNHIVALLALYRPGPMQYIDQFCSRKNGLEPVTYKHAALREALEETYGIIVYQEQVLKMLQVLAGYSLGEADLVRRAMAKKKADLLATEKAGFAERACGRGISRQLAEELFGDIEPFAGYAFGKAHAAAYAVLTCQTAYLKAHYPIEFLAGLLSAERENAEKVTEAMAECGRLGIPVLPPDINASELDFTIQDGSIRFGMSAVKNVGTAAVESIVAVRREGGKFASLADLCARIDWTVANRRALESLIKCGALDSLSLERGRLVANVERICAFAAQAHRAAAAGQSSLFGDATENVPLLHLEPATPASIEERIAWEEELIGIAVTRHPVVDAGERFRRAGAVPVAELAGRVDGEQCYAGGMIKRLRAFSTRDGKMMATFQLTDGSTAVEAVAFSRSYETMRPRLIEGSIVVAAGKIDSSDGRLRHVVDDVHPLDEAEAHPLPPLTASRRRSTGNGNGSPTTVAETQPAPSVDVDAPPSNGRRPRQLCIRVQRSGDRGHDLECVERVYATLQRYPGQDEVEILVRAADRDMRIPLPNRLVGFCAALAEDLTAVVSADCVSVDGAPVSTAF